ncbi:MAG TPA: hypothetical protein VH415_10695 [Nitrososphaeraceae archaeon]
MAATNATLTSFSCFELSLIYRPSFSFHCFNPVKKAFETRKSFNGPDIITVVWKQRAFFKDKPEKREIVDKILLACESPRYPD